MTSILYIHGLNSSPASRKAQQLLAAMRRIGLQAQLRMPALHHHPRQAIAQLGIIFGEQEAHGGDFNEPATRSPLPPKAAARAGPRRGCRR